MKINSLKTELGEFEKRLKLTEGLKPLDSLKNDLIQLYQIIPKNLNEEKDNIEDNRKKDSGNIT